VNAEEREQYASGALVTYQWLQTSLGARYIQNDFNYSLMMNWMARHGRTDWTLENLDEAFLACESEMLDKDPEPEPEPIPELEPPKPPSDEELNGPFASLTKDQVAKMSASDMRRFGKDPRFAARINSLQITRADLARKE
jgi:hypothetical protein